VIYIADVLALNLVPNVGVHTGPLKFGLSRIGIKLIISYFNYVRYEITETLRLGHVLSLNKFYKKL